MQPQDSLVVLALLEAFYFWERFSPYLWVLRRLSKASRLAQPERDDTAQYNELRPVVTELYIFSWVLGLTAIVATGQLWRHLIVLPLLFTALAAYRFLDIVIYQLKVLLDRRTAGWQNPERVLVILFIGILELALCLGVFLIAWTQTASSLAFFHGFGIVVLNADIGDSPAEEVIKTCGYIGALTIVGGALAGTWNLLGEKLRTRTPEEDARAVAAQREALDAGPRGSESG